MSARRMSVLAILLLLTGFVLSADAQASAPTESNGIAVDATHDNYVYGAGVVPPLTPAWSLSLGDDIYENIPIDDGHAFVIESNLGTQFLTSIDLATGQASWSERVNPGSGSIVVDNGLLFIEAAEPTDGLGDGYTGPLVLSAYSEATGATVWSETINSDESAANGPPIVSGGVLYVLETQEALAIDDSTGSTLWTTNLDTSTNTALDDPDDSLTIAGNTLVIGGSGCNDQEGLDAATGTVLWNANPDDCLGGGAKVASVYDGDVWMPNDPIGGAPAAVIDPATGNDLGGFPTGTPSFGYGEGVGIEQQKDGYSGYPALEAFDPTSKTVLWSEQLHVGPPQYSGALSEPLLADGYIFEATSPTFPDDPTFADVSPVELDALDPCTGAQVWQSPVDSSGNVYAMALAAGDGYLLVSTDDGNVEAFKGGGMPSGTPPTCSGVPPQTTAPSPPTPASVSTAPVQAATTPSPGALSPTPASSPAPTPTASAGADSAPSAALATPDSQTPSRATITASLRQLLSIPAQHARLARAAAAGEITLTFKAPRRGRLVVRWHALTGARHRIGKLVATASRSLHTATAARIELKLDPAGRKLLKAAKRLTIRESAVFTPAGGKPITVSRDITLHI